jgi:hypothetical protein
MQCIQTFLNQAMDQGIDFSVLWLPDPAAITFTAGIAGPLLLPDILAVVMKNVLNKGIPSCSKSPFGSDCPLWTCRSSWYI